MKDYAGNDIKVGDFLIYVTKTESPGFSFGWVEGIETKPYYGTDKTKVAVRRSDKFGKRFIQRKFIWDEAANDGHYEATGKLENLVRLDDSPDRFMVSQPL